MSLGPRTIARLMVIMVLIVCACVPALDRLAYGALHLPDADEFDWYRALRVFGYVPVWLVLALVFLLIDLGGRAPFRRASLIALTPPLAGLAAEGLKLLFRRERPGEEWGAYVFRTFSDGPWNSAGMGLPSGHTAVAMGGVLMLAYLHPRAAPIFVALGLGCGVSRMLVHAHYLSDVLVACIVAWTVARLMTMTDRDRPRAGAEGDVHE